MEASGRQGMVTMDRALDDLYQAGKISYESAVAYATNPLNITRRPEDSQEGELSMTPRRGSLSLD